MKSLKDIVHDNERGLFRAGPGAGGYVPVKEPDPNARDRRLLVAMEVETDNPHRTVGRPEVTAAGALVIYESGVVRKIIAPGQWVEVSILD